MKRCILLGCGLGLFIVAVCQKAILKQETSFSPPDLAATENTLLWKVSGNGLKNPSYIFGTMHLMCAEDAILSDTLKKIIKKAAFIYFEIDMDDMVEMAGAYNYIMMNGNKKLPDLLTEEEFRKVKDYFEDNPSVMPMQMIESLKPFFISSLVAEQRMTCAIKGGMEKTISDEALKYKKEIRGLETVAFQASVLDSIPYEQQAKELVKYIDSIAKNGKLAEELVTVYKQQDLKKIEELTKQEDGGVMEYIDLLLYDRNTDWANKMSSIMQLNSVLFAIGAAHLPGDMGVLTLLRKKGFTVSPVPN